MDDAESGTGPGPAACPQGSQLLPGLLEAQNLPAWSKAEGGGQVVVEASSSTQNLPSHHLQPALWEPLWQKT